MEEIWKDENDLKNEIDELETKITTSPGDIEIKNWFRFYDGIFVGEYSVNLKIYKNGIEV